LFTKKTIRDIDLSGKRVILRADYNVPLKNGEITNDYRIKQSLPTVEYILGKPGTRLIIMSHLGRPEGTHNPEFSLEPVAKKLSELLGKQVRFVSDCIGDNVKNAADELPEGGILLLENVRFHAEEEENNEEFARQIIESTGAELLVQDGFGVVHRAHASTEAIAKQIMGVAGFLLEKEVDTITNVMESPDRPLVAVVGGSKISDKIDVLNNFIDKADCVAVVGALGNNFLMAEGYEVGNSLVDRDDIDTAKEILEKARDIERNKQFSFLVPVDAVVTADKEGQSQTRVVDLASHTLADSQAYPKKPDHDSYSVKEDEMILDIGPISAAKIAGAIKVSRTVIWSGPCGVTEVKGIAGAQDPFAHATRAIVEAMIGDSNSHKNKPFSVVGGGDTVAYVESNGLIEDFNHVSTGGSASLELMAGKILPGVNVLWDK
jgi:phosphoglycerate kinase